MSRRSSTKKREVIYEPLAPLPQQAKFPRRRKTVHGLALAPPLPLPGLVKRQSSLTQIGWIAGTPTSDDKVSRGGEGEAEDGGVDGDGEGDGNGEYMDTNRGAKANAKGKARGGRGSGSASARRSSKKVLEKTDSQPTFTQAVRHISRSNSSDVESISSAEEEGEQPRAKTAPTSRKAKPAPKPRTTSKKLEKTDSQPTFTQALRTAPVQRAKRPAQGFEIWHDAADTPMERAAKRRKHRGEIPEVMDLVALHDSRYAHKVGHSVKGETESESPEIAESSQVLGEGMDSDEAVVLGKAHSVRKLRSRDVVSPARAAAAAEREGRRYPSLRLRKNGHAVVGERSPLKSRDANARSPTKQPRKSAKGKAGGKVQIVAGEESQPLAQAMLGVMGTQVVPSSAVVKHDSEDEDDTEQEQEQYVRRNLRSPLPRSSLARKTTIQDSLSGTGSETESEVEDLEEITPKPLDSNHHASIAESQAEDDDEAEEGQSEEENENEDAELAVVEEDENALPTPKPRTSPHRKLKRVTTIQESQVEDFGIQDEDEWDDEMGRGGEETVLAETKSVSEPQGQTRALKRKGSVLEPAQAEDSDSNGEQQRRDDQTIVQEEAEEGLEEGMGGGMPLPPPPELQQRPRAQKLRRVGTVQESQVEDFDFDCDVPLNEDDGPTTVVEEDANMNIEIEKEDVMPPPYEPQPQQGRGPRKLKRDSQIEDFGEDLEMEWVAPVVEEEAEPAVTKENAATLAEEEQAAMDKQDEVAVGEEVEAVMSEEVEAVMSEEVQAMPSENDGSQALEDDDIVEFEENEAIMPVEEKAVAVEGNDFVDIDVLLADQERTLASDRGLGGEAVEGGVQAGKQSDVHRGGDEVLQRRSQPRADDLDAGGLRAELYEKSPALANAVKNVAELQSRREAGHDGAGARVEQSEAIDGEWYSTARERSSQRSASQRSNSGNGSGAVVLPRDAAHDEDPRVGPVEIIDLQSEEIDGNATLGVNNEKPVTSPSKTIALDDAKIDPVPPPTSGHLEQITKPIEIIELTSDNEDDENYEDETMPDLESANNDDDKPYYEGTYDPASAALDRDAARFAQRTQTQGWKQTQFSVYSHDLDEPAPMVKYRPFMTPGKVYKKTFDEPVGQEDEEWEDDEAGMQLEAELSGAVSGVVVGSQAGERVGGGGIVVQDSQSAVVDVSRSGEEARDVLADEERVPSSPPALLFTKPALPELQPVLPAGDERVPSSPPAIRPSQVSTAGPTQLSSVRPGSRQGLATETQWSLHSPPKFTQPRWQHQEETLSSSPLALPPWTSPERRRFADMGMGNGKGKQAVMGSMGGYSLGELEDFSLPPPPPISSSRAGTQSGRSSSPVVR
ncbi:hypothetical protein LTR17_012148 [Elasticomyces elasticus]|nr:hypothetical protein LTR17_012148 [Elasticomyces elasticus]